MKSSALPFVLALVVMLATAYGLFKVFQLQHQRTLAVSPVSPGAAPAEETPLEPLTEFTLTERSGQTFDSDDMAGDVWVVTFFYARCGSVCTMLNQHLADMQQDADLDGVRFVSITCDPANDTLAVLRDTAKTFGADPVRWLFCRGEQKYVNRVGQDIFKVSVAKGTHTERGIVIDRQGNVRGRFLVTDAPGYPHQRVAMKRALLECLREPKPAATTDVPVEKQSAEAAATQEAEAGV